MSFNQLPAFEQKILTFNSMSQTLASLVRPIVFTNGCFDILHRGHTTYLAQAKELGATLVVAVNSDDSVKKLGKGQDRPIHSEQDRITVTHLP